MSKYERLRMFVDDTVFTRGPVASNFLVIYGGSYSIGQSLQLVTSQETLDKADAMLKGMEDHQSLLSFLAFIKGCDLEIVSDPSDHMIKRVKKSIREEVLQSVRGFYEAVGGVDLEYAIVDIATAMEGKADILLTYNRLPFDLIEASKMEDKPDVWVLPRNKEYSKSMLGLY